MADSIHIFPSAQLIELSPQHLDRRIGARMSVRYDDATTSLDFGREAACYCLDAVSQIPTGSHAHFSENLTRREQPRRSPE
jgi:hypothetical protein